MNLAKKNQDHIFRAYDIRAIYGEEINPQFMFKLGIAVANVGRNDFGDNIHVYVGYDIRQSSQLLAYSFISGLTSLGVKVTFSNQTFPFGAVMYSGLCTKAHFTAFITASHLPADWNGMKFYYGDGVGFSESKILEIRDSYKKISSEVASFVTWDQIKHIKTKHYFDEYLSLLKDKFTLKKKIKVLLDCGNGSASLLASTIFKECNYDILEHWCTVDPTFPNRSSEPTEESLQVMRQRVLSENVAFGVGFDGDGDRAVIVDEKGSVVPADSIAILLAEYLHNNVFKYSNPIILANIECSSVIERLLEPKFQIIRIPVGHTFLTLEARKNKSQCILGVESSGHFVFPPYFLFDDAFLIPLLVGKLLLDAQTPLSKLVEKIQTMFTARQTFSCPDTTKFGVIKSLFSELQSKYFNLNTIDGIAIDIENKGYVLIRASNTGPKIRIFVESDSNENKDLLLLEFSSLIAQKIKELNS